MENTKMNDILISVIMAAYNSESTIDKSLASIREQTIDQNRIEILVIDGFSTDRTRELVNKYSAEVIDNPDRLPEPAKRIGIQKAKGKYILIMDSDEVLPDRTVLERRISFLNRHKELVCLVGGVHCPSELPACGHYISNVGDPFSAFVYDWYIGGNMGLIKKKNVADDKDGYIGYFRRGDVIPIGDSVTMMDRDYILSHYGELVKSENTATLFHKIVIDTHYVGHVKGDYVLHYTKSDIKTYMKKLKFRVINNIFDIKGSGYSARQEMQTKKSYKKYFYPLYCMSFIFPFFDGYRMAMYYKHPVYLLHPFFSWYVLYEIMIQMVNKMIGNKSVNNAYAK